MRILKLLFITFLIVSIGWLTSFFSKEGINQLFAQNIQVFQQSEKMKHSSISDKDLHHLFQFIDHKKENDPFIEVENGVFVKKSNLQGIKLNGKTYYYSLYPHMSYDPLSLGKLAKEEINVIYRNDDENFPVIIYTKD